MGSLNNGLFGGFNGRIGNLVGYSLNGKHVVRTIGKSNKPPTLPKLVNYQRMQAVNSFLSPLQYILKIGFRNQVANTNRNAYNEALAYHKKHALTGEYPNISLDYPKALLSIGTLIPANNPSILKTGDGIQFNWDTAEDTLANPHDRVTVLVLFPKSQTLKYIFSGAKREEGEQFLPYPPNLGKEHMEAYILFTSPDGQEISNSVHAGSFAEEEK